ncbi:MAG: dihydroorotase [Bacteroidota bacterium]|nr:dihydroorotase [Bacteroidota bacterium]
MDIIIKQARIIGSDNPYHNQIKDIKIKNGFIIAIEDEIPQEEGFRIITYPNLQVSEGWFDSSVCFAEPGFEERETIVHGLEVAQRSGFTAVALNPYTNPVVDNQALIQFVKQKSVGSSCTIYPIGALTKDSDTKNLAELYDMQNAGAVAFGDYKKSIANANVLKLALQYVQDFNGLVIAFSQNKELKGAGIANEGVNATKLGMKGISNLSEEIEILRNLHLLEYTGGKLHLPTISTKESVAHIKAAKERGLQVTCSVAVHNLCLNDDVLIGFDTNYKVNPPIRTEEDRLALIEGVQQGVIDMITSDHNPLDIELKKVEFDKAHDGVIGLETAFGTLNKVLDITTIVDRFTQSKTIFGIERTPVEVGQKANLTLFNSQERYVFTEECILSKSKNSPFIGAELQGKVYEVIVG